MKSLEFALLWGGLLAFAAGTAAAAAAVRSGTSRLLALVRAAAGLGIGLHAAFLAVTSAREGRFPVESTLEAFVFLAAALTAAAILLDLLRGMPILLIAAMPLALLTTLLALALTLAPPRTPADAPGPSGAAVALHAAGALASYAAFALAFASGVVYIVAHRQLKRHGPSPVLGLMPPLETVGRVNVRSIAAGVVLLAAGLVAGYLYARELYPGQRGWRLDPKVFLTTITVAAYAVVLGLSRRPAFRGRRTAVASMACFALVLVTFWANIIWRGFHSR